MSDRICIGTRKGLFTATRRRNGGWRLSRPQFAGDPVTLVLADARDGMLYAALNLGHFGVKLRRSADGGRRWTECPAPAYPVPTADTAAADAPKLELIWSFEAGGGDQPGQLWAGTLPGGLFRSTDRGEHWELVRGLWDRPERADWGGGGYDHPGIHSICVDPRDSARVSVAVSTGGVWQTLDGGATWTCRAQGMRAAYMPPEQAYNPNAQDVHRMVQCRSRPDTLWAQHHNGIFVSRDGAANWLEIENVMPSAFGFAAAVHPADPDTAWFVPAVKDETRIPVDARFVVNRTRDGGRSFETLNRGLPRGAAYDLVYRHGLDVSADGRRLAMGSTTGGLWVSEDGGDSWKCLSAHLPPVNCVRFAA